MITLTPAYGRDYKDAASVREDWEANKDFVIADISHPYNGKYANKSDLTGSVKQVRIRYNRLEDFTVIDL